MIRNVSLNEISDGKLYGLNDLVKADCNGCKDCSACCQGMGNSIILDPLDIYRLSMGLRCTFEELLNRNLELNVVDGIILPNLKMAGETERCTFLNSEDRCSIHNIRPGVCRLFPLGRYYENNTFRYFLQVHECMKNRIKTKVRKWIDTPDLKKNEQFVLEWHFFLKAAQNSINNTQDNILIKNINMYILKSFYMKRYDENYDFYIQFNERLSEAKIAFDL